MVAITLVQILAWHDLFSYLLIIFCYELIILMDGSIYHRRVFRCDRIVVRTLRCGRNNPGSNPGRCMIRFNIHLLHFVII